MTLRHWIDHRADSLKEYNDDSDDEADDDDVEEEEEEDDGGHVNDYTDDTRVLD